MALSSVTKFLRRSILRGIAYGFQFLSLAMLVGVVLFLLPLALPYIEGATNFSYVRAGLGLQKDISEFVKQQIPTVVSGMDITRWIVIAVLVIAGGSFGRLQQQFRDRAEYLRFKMSYDELKERTHLSDNSRVFTPLKQKLDTMSVARKKDREELLELFAETKKKLKTMGRDLAFLSIDVVDSTGMKQGEEREAVEYDFKQYKRFVEGTLATNSCVKSTWTPDGVMSAFASVDAAVKTGREVIIGLDAFNANIKTMKRDFSVRCGVNAGFVYFEESTPLEEISDRVIDIAGHMQKHAMPGTVCVAKPVIEPLTERTGFHAAGREVDGYEVYEWRKE